MNKIKDLYRRVRIFIIRLFATFYSQEMSIPESILIIAPHPDDEIFGCAGLIQRALSEKKKVNVIILTRGEGAYPEELISREELIKNRKQLTLNASKRINLLDKNIHFLKWKDGGVTHITNYDEITSIIETVNPTAIFSPHPLEGWNDHLAASQIVDSLISSYHSHIKNYKYNVWTWYSMPYSKLPQMGWKQSFILKMNKKEHQHKLEAIDEYIKPLTSFGKPYSGDLPKLFIEANQWRKELYFSL